MAVWPVHLKRGGKSRRKSVFSFLGDDLLRTRIYIDGYNLYYGCLKGTSLKWLRASSQVVIGLVIPTTDHQRIPSTELAHHAHWVRTHITHAELKAAQFPRVIQGRRPAVKPDSWFARPDLLQRALKLGESELGSRSKVFQWLGKPNPHYGGEAPIDLLETTDGEHVIYFMEKWATSTPNQAPSQGTP
jgi:uncharacterized protein (DUF2384 family)